MKALSIRQPWPYCMTDLPIDRKRTENRSWPLPKFIIGKRIAIHASGKFDTLDDRISASTLAGFKLSTQKENMPLGAIVATAVFTGYVHCLPNGQYQYVGDVGDNYDPQADKWLFGPYGWRLVELCKLNTPILCTGALQFWNVPDPVYQQIKQQQPALFTAV